MAGTIRVAVMLSLASACFPYATPPAQVKIGAGWTSKPFEYDETFNGTTTKKTTNKPGYFEAGLTSASMTDYPLTFGSGVTFALADTGLYGDVGTVYRVLPKLRVATSVGYERWLEGDGNGVKLSLIAEYVSKQRWHASSNDIAGTGSHSGSTLYEARAGSFGVGVFLDVGHRWMPDANDNSTYVVGGVAFHLAALAGVETFWNH